MLLSATTVTTMIPVVDVKRARKFYEEKLGFKPQPNGHNGDVQYRVPGSILALYARPTPTKSDATLATFEVKDVEAEMKELQGKGIKFEDYDMPNIKTKNGLAIMANEKAAWFKDTEGNILCIHQNV